ncbi:MAG: hypothetical protein S4CHLAM2_14370 [Chlamydiales bacterium]|nr:hypothetical protein [Chlamydiales bacterium]
MNFQIFSTLIFALAVVHTFLTPTLYSYSQKLGAKKRLYPRRWRHYHFLSEIFYLISEVEVVFGIWLVPLLVASTLIRGWDVTLEYVNTRSYTHALYITVILVVIGSRPIITFAETILEKIARLGKDTPAAWWWTIVTIGPLLGALIKEPAAMALSAILLSKKFYPYYPSRRFQYATLGLLFANISVGGMLTTFSSRALFIVADRWDWDWTYMLVRFGWKEFVGMLIATGLYYILFRKEFQKERFPKKLPALEKEEAENPTPVWITVIHVIFVGLIVITGETAPLFLGVFLLFLGFWKATPFYQTPLHLRAAILVGFFFASLIIHGELQGWWIIPLMESLNHFGAMMVSFVLSAFIDNAVVSYLTLDIPHFDDLKHYLVVSGAMCAGALTVIANAPNPVGHAILRPSFQGKIAYFPLFLGAMGPALIYLSLFWFFR